MPEYHPNAPQLIKSSIKCTQAALTGAHFAMAAMTDGNIGKRVDTHGNLKMTVKCQGEPLRIKVYIPEQF